MVSCTWRPDYVSRANLLRHRQVSHCVTTVHPKLAPHQVLRYHALVCLITSAEPTYCETDRSVIVSRPSIPNRRRHWFSYCEKIWQFYFPVVDEPGYWTKRPLPSISRQLEIWLSKTVQAIILGIGRLHRWNKNGPSKRTMVSAFQNTFQKLIVI